MVQKSLPRAYLGSFFDYGPCMGNLPHGLAEASNVTSTVCCEDLPVFFILGKTRKIRSSMAKNGGIVNWDFLRQLQNKIFI